MDVVEISRKVRLTKNKYQSIYYFNGNPCTQAEIHDHLSRAGITPEGYNVVMQGDVTRIIEMSSLERRRIVDEIAGVAEFDEKKKKALEELEVVRGGSTGETSSSRRSSPSYRGSPRRGTGPSPTRPRGRRSGGWRRSSFWRS